MKIEQIYGDDHSKILKAVIPAGGAMPRHYATSDAFVIIVQGRAVLTFVDSEASLQGGSTFLIPGNVPHTLQVQEDFEAYIVLGPKAGIELAGKEAEGERGNVKPETVGS